MGNVGLGSIYGPQKEFYNNSFSGSGKNIFADNESIFRLQNKGGSRASARIRQE